MALGSSPVAVTSDFAPASSKEFLDIQATIECGFTLKRVRDMARTYSQMNIMITIIIVVPIKSNMLDYAWIMYLYMSNGMKKVTSRKKSILIRPFLTKFNAYKF